LNFSQPAAALQSQKAQPPVLPLVQSQNNSTQAVAPQKQVLTNTDQLLLTDRTEELFAGANEYKP